MLTVRVIEPEFTPAQLALIARIRPMTKRLIISAPKALLRERHSGAVAIPDAAREINKEYGLSCKVLKIGAEVDIPIGAYVLVPMYSGIPLAVDDCIPAWTVGEGDIIAILDDPNLERANETA